LHNKLSQKNSLLYLHVKF